MMHPLTIEKGVPIPPLSRRRGPGSFEATGLTAALRSMEVGDSIPTSYPHPALFGDTLSRVKDSHGYRFTTRIIEGRVTVWRTA